MDNADDGALFPSVPPPDGGWKRLTQSLAGRVQRHRRRRIVTTSVPLVFAAAALTLLLARPSVQTGAPPAPVVTTVAATSPSTPLGFDHPIFATVAEVPTLREASGTVVSVPTRSPAVRYYRLVP